VNQDVDRKDSSVTDKKKQQILVPHDFSDACNCAVNYGIILARIFRCELTLVHIITKEMGKKQGGITEADQAARTRMAGMVAYIQKQTTVVTNAYVIQGKVSGTIRSIIEGINAIVMVAGLNPVNRTPQHYFSPNSLVTEYRELRIPLLIVQNKMPDAQTFRQIILPVDFSKESKEKASWAGYFSKLNHSAITIIHTSYSDDFFATQLRNNLILIKKLFNTLNAAFEIHKAEKVRYGIDRYGVAYAKMKGAGMIIIMTTKEMGIDDFFLGPREKRIITNEDQLPVMMINPRDDLYVPCV
jgi:nucleotide-binding universal stress UspA family protein